MVLRVFERSGRTHWISATLSAGVAAGKAHNAAVVAGEHDSGIAHEAGRNPRDAGKESWCSGRDSNSHGFRHCPSRQRVHQFHHQSGKRRDDTKNTPRASPRKRRRRRGPQIRFTSLLNSIRLSASLHGPRMTLITTRRNGAHSRRSSMPSNQAAQPHVGLFATCLMNVFRPNIGLATVTLLERAGCRVSAPSGQTCWPAGLFGRRRRCRLCPGPPTDRPVRALRLRGRAIGLVHGHGA